MRTIKESAGLRTSEVLPEVRSTEVCRLSEPTTLYALCYARKSIVFSQKQAAYITMSAAIVTKINLIK